MINKFIDCKTARTGLYKPHTIYLSGSFGVSIVYYARDKKMHNKKVAIATDINGNIYEVYETKSIYGNIGFLAFPKDPKKIRGFYPWL